MRISDWSSDVCSSDLRRAGAGMAAGAGDRKRDVARGRAARITGRLPWQMTKQCKCYNISILDIDPAPSHGSPSANLTHESPRSEEHTSELQSLMRIPYAVFCLKKKKKSTNHTNTTMQYTHE